MAAIQLASVVRRLPSQPRQGIPRAMIAHNVGGVGGGRTGASVQFSPLTGSVSVYIHGETFTAQALTTSKSASQSGSRISGRPGSGSRKKTATARTHGNSAAERRGTRDVGRNPFLLGEVDFGGARRSCDHGVVSHSCHDDRRRSFGDSGQNFSNYAAASAAAFRRRATPLRNIGMQAGTRTTTSKERKKQHAATRSHTLTKKAAQHRRSERRSSGPWLTEVTERSPRDQPSAARRADALPPKAAGGERFEARGQRVYGFCSVMLDPNTGSKSGTTRPSATKCAQFII